MTQRSRRVAIVDTSIVSYGIKYAPLAFPYERLLADYEVRISFMTVAELRFGAEKRRWSQRRRLELEVLLHKYSVVPYSDEMAAVYAEIMAHRQRVGRPMESADAWIAATAIVMEAPLATNDSDFLNTPGLRLITADLGEVPALPRLRAEARPARPLGADCGCRM